MITVVGSFSLVSAKITLVNKDTTASINKIAVNGFIKALNIFFNIESFFCLVIIFLPNLSL